MRARQQAITTLQAVGVCCFLATLRGFVYTAASSPPFGHTTATFFTLVALAIAALISLAHNRPWEGTKGRLTERHMVRLVTVGALLALTTCASVYTLRVVGPVRATLLEHLDLALVPGAGYLFYRSRRAPVLRGVALALAAALMVAWYDPGAVELAQQQAETAGGLRALGVEEVRAEAAAANVAAAAGAGGALGDAALPSLPYKRHHRARVAAAAAEGGGGGGGAPDEAGRPLPTPLRRSTQGAPGDGAGIPAPHMAGGAIDAVQQQQQQQRGPGGLFAPQPSAAADSAAQAAAAAVKSRRVIGGGGTGRFGLAQEGSGGAAAAGGAAAGGPPSPPPAPILAALQQQEAAAAAAAAAAAEAAAAAASEGGSEDGSGAAGDDAAAEHTQDGDDSLNLLDAYEDLLRDPAGSASGSGAAEDTGSVEEGSGSGAADAAADSAPPQAAEGGEAAEALLVKQQPAAQPSPALVPPPVPPPPAAEPAPAAEAAAAAAPQPPPLPLPPKADAAAAAAAPAPPARQRLLLEVPPAAIGLGGGGLGGGFAPPPPPPLPPGRRNPARNAGLYLLRQAARLRATLSLHARSSVLLACVFLGLAAWGNSIRRTLEKGLVADTGMSARKVHAVVLTTALLLWVPVTLLRGWVLGLWGDGSSSVPGGGADEGVGGGAWGRVAVVRELARLAALAVRGGDASALNAPSALWFTVVAAVYAIGVLLLGEYAADIPISGLEALKGGLVLPSLQAPKLKDEGGGGEGGGGGGGSGSAGGSAEAGSASASGGGGSSHTHASAAAATLLRLCSALTAMLTAAALCSGPAMPGSPTQVSSPLLWVGAALALLGLAQAGGLDAMQLSRLYSTAVRGGNAVIASGSGGGGGGGGGGDGGGSGGDGWAGGSSILAFLLGSASSSSSSSSSASASASSSSPSSDGKHDKPGGGGALAGAGSGGCAAQVRKVMAHIWEDKNSRRIFQFLTINFLFMFVEIFVGFYSNSLGLISDAGHMFFDNASLFIGLYASYMARWRIDARFTYGYSRYEVLAGFVNAIFLVFVALSVVMEAMERLWEPPEIRGDHLLVVSVGGLLVNILGLVFFHDVAHAHGGHGHGGGGGECSGHGHGANENMMGVYLHVLADALGSVGVIISSLLIQWYGWHLADPVTSIIISFMILASVGPLIAVTAGPLLSRTPEHLEAPLRDALGAVERIPEVLSATQPHFWKQHSDHLVGSLHITIAPGSDRQKVFNRVLGMFHELGVRNMTLQLEYVSERDMGV